MRGDEPQHVRVDRLVVGRRAEHVDVHVPVAEVAVEDRAAAVADRRASTASANAAIAASGTETSSLCGTPAALSASLCASR